MRSVRRPPTTTAITLIFLALALAWSLYLGATQIAASATPLDRLESLTLDWRYALVGPRPAPRGVVIAAIDEETLRLAGAYPLPRDALAKIVRGLAAEAPQVVGLDILLLDPGPPHADRALVEAMRATRVVLGAVGIFGSSDAAPTAIDAPPAPTTILWPQQQFREAAASGLCNIALDAQGSPRYAPLLFTARGALVRSFALVAATAASNLEAATSRDAIKIGARTIPLDYGYHLPLRFYGPSGAIRTFSAAKALRGELADEELRGQTVLLGVTAAGTGDRFVTPFDGSTPGVEIFATAIANLLAGDALIKNAQTRQLDAAAGVLLAAGSVLLLASPRAAVGLGVSISVHGLWLAGVVLAFARGYDLGVAEPLAASLPLAASYGATRLWAAQRAARRLWREGETLRRFQDPRIADLLARDPNFLAQPLFQEAAVVFVDLSGFTRVTEALGPAWTRELLAGLHEIIETTTLEGDGFVASYMGDGAMIVFGLPRPRPDDAGRALATMARLHARAKAWVRDLPPVAREHLGARVGGHFGQVALSRLGAASHQHFTATGDTVNVASRFLEVAKELEVGVVASEDLCAAAASYAAPPAGDAKACEVAIRGRSSPISVRTWAM